MKKFATTSATVLALAMSANGAMAADYDAQVQQLVVSGVVENWNGVTFVSSASGDVTPDQDTIFSSGLAGRLSLPLGSNVSLQSDIDIEYGDTAFAGTSADDNLQLAFQFGTHLSWRDPNRGLFGAFGGFGGARSDDGVDSEFWFAGGEAQLYTSDVTYYLQVGAIDGENATGTDDVFRDAFFVRGVARWFLMPNSRVQFEAAYANGVADSDRDDTDIIEWGARYDTLLAGLPLIGDTPLFVGYRGTLFENPDNSGGGTDRFVEHTVMIGTSYHFGGANRMEFERTGAGLDLPQIGRWVSSGEVLD